MVACDLRARLEKHTGEAPPSFRKRAASDGRGGTRPEVAYHRTGPLHTTFVPTLSEFAHLRRDDFSDRALGKPLHHWFIFNAVAMSLLEPESPFTRQPFAGQQP